MLIILQYTQLIIISLILFIISTSSGGANNLHIFDGTTIQEVIGSDVFFEIVDPIELGYTYRLRPAKNYGTSFTAKDFRVKEGSLVPTIPRDGCSKIKNSRSLRGNIALLERGECSFQRKALNVEKVGAIAAIITDTDNKSLQTEFYIDMIHDNSSPDSNIPSGFLLGKNGHMILTTLEKLDRHYATINIPVNLTFTPIHQINHPPWLSW